MHAIAHGPGSDEDPRGSDRIAKAAALPAGSSTDVVAKALPAAKALPLPAGSSSDVFPPAKAKSPAKAKAPAKTKAGAKAKAGVAEPPPVLKAKAKAPPPLVAPPAEDLDFGPAGDVVPDPPVPVRGRRRTTAPRKMVDAIGGGQVNFTEYPDPHTGRVYANWLFQCPHHPGCERVLGLGARNTRRHGPLEPLAFLHVWRDVVPEERGHRLTPVRDAALVSRFFTDHESELNAIFEQFASP